MFEPVFTEYTQPDGMPAPDWSPPVNYGSFKGWSTPRRPLLLVVDDEPQVLTIIERLAVACGFDVVTCTGGSQAMQALARRPADVAMVDLRMPDVSGLDLLQQIRAAVPSCEVILMTGYAAVDSAVEAIKRGAREYLSKPFDFDRLRQLLTAIREELERRASVIARESQMAPAPDFYGMVGRSPAMKEVFGLIRRLAPHAKVVLIQGETGTGKELAARAFHQAGPRRHKPFVALNCSAVVDALSLFEAAHGGTVFLDEVGELPLSVQASLLRTLENGEVPRIGSLQPRKVDVTVVAATNRDLRAEVAAGRFRGDLFYRLNVVGVLLPPLRERREDIPPLTAAFIHEAAGRLRKPVTGLTPPAERLLRHARWDGNVRELRNAIERACMLAEGPVLSERELAGAVGLGPSSAHPARPDAGAAPAEPVALGDLEREHIVEVLRQMHGNRMAAAKALGISRRALYRRLERHQIGDEVPRRQAGRREDRE